MRWTDIQKERFFLPLLFVLALALRLAYAYYLLKHYPFYDYPGDDVLYYRQWASDIASGNWVGHGVFLGMPLYPYFLAVLMKLSLGHFSIVRLAHLALGALNGVLVYAVASKAFPKKMAVLASLLVATNFTLIYYDWLMMPVTLITFIGLAAAFGLVRLDTSRQPLGWLALGLVFGVGMLADGKVALVLALVIAALAYAGRGRILVVAKKTLLPLAAGACVVLAVVTVRNRVVGGDWVVVSAHDGINFYVGNNPAATGTFVNPPFLRPNHYGHEEDPAIVAQQLLGRRLTSSEVYLRVLRLQPGARDARANLVNLYLRSGRIQEAQRLMR
jgi:4-amino-4-deoxy-L-arabinose transferase-like glycosyltransferase